MLEFIYEVEKAEDITFNKVNYLIFDVIRSALKEENKQYVQFNEKRPNAGFNHPYLVIKKENFGYIDIIAVTEAVVSIAQGNYATLDQIAYDVKEKFSSKHIGLVFPILSRNRFANLLRAIARAMDKLTILLSYTKDEVGNSILYEKDLERLGINPYDTIIDEATYQKEFSHFKHPFTVVNMVQYYKDLIEKENCEVSFVFSNNPQDIRISNNQVVFTKDTDAASYDVEINGVVFNSKADLPPYLEPGTYDVRIKARSDQYNESDFSPITILTVEKSDRLYTSHNYQYSLNSKFELPWLKK